MINAPSHSDTQAVAAGLMDRLMGWDDLIATMDAAGEPKKRGTYKKRVGENSN